MSPNLSSQCISAMAAVTAIKASDNEHPMRHAVRNIKQQAEDVLANAFRTAEWLAATAQMVVDDYDRSQDTA